MMSPHDPEHWQHETPVALWPQVQRLTAPNPGVMTGPGTNSYLVGTQAAGWIVIDPGPYATPAEMQHVERLLKAAGGNIRAIVCTHSHPDHSPAAQPLQQLCEERSGNKPLICGLPSVDTARSDSRFAPDRTLASGEQIDVGRLTLHIIHTPGHASNHLCLLMQASAATPGLLFSGDHILQGSTTVINPPDGNMTDYLDSLDALAAACEKFDAGFILPAHGHVIRDAHGEIARLKRHRLQREAKILRVMQAQPEGTLDDWLPRAYDDADPALWPIARRSLLAHVERLRKLESN